MDDNSYLYVIIALLPLSSVMLVFQVNPYHALVIRGILGAIAALVYALLGAADVALTEALVGTMLAVTLNAVAVRSSLVMRLGVLENEPVEARQNRELAQPSLHPLQPLIDDLQTVLSKHYMRLELVTYPNQQILHQALMTKEIHATCVGSRQLAYPSELEDVQPYQTTVRVRRLYEIMQAELPSSMTSLVCVSAPDINPLSNTPNVPLAEPGAQP